MSKKEFLDILRKTLDGEVDQNIIDQNISFYDEYISSNSDNNEGSVLKELGDPRLIAKTIIETEKISKQKERYSSGTNYTGHYDQKAEDSQNETYHGYDGENRRSAGLSLKWYHKAMMITIIILVLIILIVIGRFLMRILFAFMVPILLVFLLLALFRRR